MKTKITALLIAAAAVLTTSCEQHKWSETKQLFEKHDHAKDGGDHSRAKDAKKDAAH